MSRTSHPSPHRQLESPSGDILGLFRDAKLSGFSYHELSAAARCEAARIAEGFPAPRHVAPVVKVDSSGSDSVLVVRLLLPQPQLPGLPIAEGLGGAFASTGWKWQVDDANSVHLYRGPAPDVPRHTLLLGVATPDARPSDLAALDESESLQGVAPLWIVADFDASRPGDRLRSAAMRGWLEARFLGVIHAEPLGIAQSGPSSRVRPESQVFADFDSITAKLLAATALAFEPASP